MLVALRVQQVVYLPNEYTNPIHMYIQLVVFLNEAKKKLMLQFSFFFFSFFFWRGGGGLVPNWHIIIEKIKSFVLHQTPSTPTLSSHSISNTFTQSSIRRGHPYVQWLLHVDQRPPTTLTRPPPYPPNLEHSPTSSNILKANSISRVHPRRNPMPPVRQVVHVIHLCRPHLQKSNLSICTGRKTLRNVASLLLPVVQADVTQQREEHLNSNTLHYLYMFANTEGDSSHTDETSVHHSPTIIYKLMVIRIMSRKCLFSQNITVSDLKPSEILTLTAANTC